VTTEDVPDNAKVKHSVINAIAILSVCFFIDKDAVEHKKMVLT